jgi:ferredoxin
MANGKATLLRDDYCDGLGDCLPACPADAIHFVERDAAAYDAVAVLESKAAKREAVEPLACGCPGTRSREIRHGRDERPAAAAGPTSQLSQWPVQIKLAPPTAPYFDGADLLVAATCSAYAFADFHDSFIHGRITLVGCPKLDGIDYTEKLATIIKGNDITSLMVVRMEVPCCGGLERAAVEAVRLSGKDIPCTVVTVSTEGEILG